MHGSRSVISALPALSLAGLLAVPAAGSTEMTWLESVVLGDWNLVTNWIPPFGELPSVPDSPGEAAVIPDYDGIVSTTTTLDIDPQIDYLRLENPDGLLLLSGHTLTLLGTVEQSINAGQVVADTGLCTIDGSFVNVGALDVDPGVELVLTGPDLWNFLGVISAASDEFGTGILTLDGVSMPSTAADFGEIVLASAFVGDVQYDAELHLTGGSFTNTNYHTIRGSGLITGTVINEGTIQFEGDEGMSLRIAGGNFINRGTTSVTDIAAILLKLQGGTVDVTGGLSASDLEIDGGCTLTVAAPLSLANTWFWLNGTLDVPNGVELTSSTTVFGTGEVIGHVQNTAGQVRPGNSAGTLTFESYNQDTNGLLAIDLSSTTSGVYENDLLEVTYAATLGGELEIIIEDQPWPFPAPDVGTSFVILTAAELSFGTTFDVVTPEWGTFDVDYDYDNDTVTITVTDWPPCNVPYDVDGDGVIGINDFLQVLANWGPCEGCPADVDDDGVVGINDFLGVLAHWGSADCW